MDVCWCGQSVWEDSGFTVVAIYYNSPRRRYCCLAGHSTYLPPPEKPQENPVEKQRQYERNRKGGLASQAKRRAKLPIPTVLVADDDDDVA